MFLFPTLDPDHSSAVVTFRRDPAWIEWVFVIVSRQHWLALRGNTRAAHTLNILVCIYIFCQELSLVLTHAPKFR